MSGHHHHRRHHHKHQAHQEYPQGGYPAAYLPAPTPYFPGSGQMEGWRHAEEEAKKHKHREHMAEAGAVAAGAFAMYEMHEAKVDPQHAGRHKLEAEIAGAAAMAAAGYAVYEHHESSKYHHIAQSHHNHNHHGHLHHHHHRH